MVRGGDRFGVKINIFPFFFCRKKKVKGTSLFSLDFDGTRG